MGGGGTPPNPAGAPGAPGSPGAPAVGAPGAAPRALLRLPPRALVGMVHVGALPGTPRAREPVAAIARRAAQEAATIVDAGFDAVIVENMHDVPYLARDVGPEIVAAMTAVAVAVRERVAAPIGVQVLAGANRAALAVALAAGCEFVRAEGFVFAGVADEGLLAEADAGPLLRYRRAIGAEAVAVVADILKKHTSHAIIGDLDIAGVARAAAFFGVDGVVVTGDATGSAVAVEDLAATRAAVELPLLVGSGATPESLAALFAHADGVIVGSAIKRSGRWEDAVDAERCAAFVAARASLPRR
ncbi:MAG TPA: BtpA/SgcQ family protein [Phycisphaerales bacterium]|nr:BtpA/SgcQ family protein [Phycisphaerales bacterium]HMP36877.1 BtpA/SgcQ family protein [Phycisphaerales bacterium]